MAAPSVGAQDEDSPRLVAESVNFESEGNEILERFIAADRDAELRQSRVEKDVVAKTGEWHSRRFQSNDRGWQVQLERDRKTGKVSGSIRLNGSRTMPGTAKVDGQMNGSSVTGVVIDDEGRQLATFSGALSGRGMAGSYVTFDGDKGDWSYGDPAPEVSLEELEAVSPSVLPAAVE